MVLGDVGDDVWAGIQVSLSLHLTVTAFWKRKPDGPVIGFELATSCMSIRWS